MIHVEGKYFKPQNSMALCSRIMVQTKIPRSGKKTVLLITVIVVGLSAYFLLSLYFFPKFYLSNSPKTQAKPFISDVVFPSSEVHLGKPFQASVTAVNHGDNADIQLVSISFPNLTNTKDAAVRVTSTNFTQEPILIQQGDDIGSSYRGLADTIPAKYPSIQFYSRPWKSGVFYGAQFEISPPSAGKFTILIKAVALPYIDTSSHYPYSGVMDFQREYVIPYSVNVIMP
jgi:hypothetical protein